MALEQVRMCAIENCVDTIPFILTKNHFAKWCQAMELNKTLSNQAAFRCFAEDES
jgi:hypothetical protein